MSDNESNSPAGDALASPALRWVVLYHDGVADPHFDLMIEAHPGGSLHTWRCEQNPLRQHVTSATRIANHRRHYLDYEGEVLGGRGRVSRVAEGRGRFRRVKQRTWLWEAGADALCGAYWMAPAVARAQSRRWMIEGQTAG